MIHRGAHHSQLAAALLLVVLATVLVFARTLSASFVDFDDPQNLLMHTAWRGLSGEHLRWMATSYWMGHWHPLTWLSWALDHAIFGLNPFGYHLQNLLWHLACAVLAFFLIRRFVRHELAAAAGALFFAIHPLRVESVAWVTERRDVLSGAFWLASLLCYLRAHEQRKRLWLALSVACCALSLLAKAWAITLPLVLIVLDAAWLGRSLRSRALWLEKLPFLALALFAAVQAFRAQASAGTMLTLESHPLGDRIAQALYGLWFYPWATLWPAGLIPCYELGGDPSQVPWRGALGAAFVLACVALCALVRRTRPWLPAALVSYALVIAPVLGLAQSGPQAVADRYSYLACIPFALLFAAAVARTRAMRFVAGPWLAALALVAVVQCGLWQDETALWTTTFERAPSNVRANLYLGNVCAARRDWGAAEEHFRRAHAQAPDRVECLNNLAAVLLVRGNKKEARDLWRRAIADHAGEPETAQARKNLADLMRSDPELFDGK